MASEIVLGQSIMGKPGHLLSSVFSRDLNLEGKNGKIACFGGGI